MKSGVELDIIQDKQIIDDFVEAKSGRICGIMGNRSVKSCNSNISLQIWYMLANYLYRCSILQKSNI